MTELDALRAELASRQIDVDTFREGNQKLRAEVAEWKERHPYSEVDLDMAIEAETKDLKLRIDTLESAQIDYEAQCAAKDARIKEEFDKYCRNLTELAQVHKESCDAKDARIAGLDAEQALHIEAYKSMLARAERAEASHEQQVIVAANYAERAERAEAKLAAVDKQREDFFWDKQRAEAEALKAKAHIAALCDAMVYSDSYGVQGSEFQCCHACSAGGAPNVVFKHDEHCPVGKAEASAAEWWDDYKAAEEDRERAEAERDAMREALERVVAKCPKLAPVCIAAEGLAALGPFPAGEKS